MKPVTETTMTLTIKIPEFRYDFFDGKSNAALCSITHHYSEITPMIYDYFDYHTGTHPVCKTIIELLRETQKYLYAWQDNFIENTTLDRYHELENEMMAIFNNCVSITQSGEYNQQDTAFLLKAIEYTKKTIFNTIRDASQTHAAITSARLLQSPLIKQINQFKIKSQ